MSKSPNNIYQSLKRGLLILALVFFAHAGDYWQQSLHYTMEISLIPEDTLVTGKSVITYINNSPDTLTKMYLNIYPNAFQIGSVKHQEFLRKYGALGRAIGFTKGLEKYLHRFTIVKFEIVMDDGQSTNKYNLDDTILESNLPHGLPNGDSLKIIVHWRHKNGEMFERAGRIENQYNMAQWYPKPVVFDQEGWQVNPFHAEGEFYGEFGSFRVAFDLPEQYAIGATGVVIEGDPGWKDIQYDTSMVFSDWITSIDNKKEDGDYLKRRHVVFEANNVHDFAWVASNNFVYESVQHAGVDIHVLYDKSNGNAWSKEVTKRTVRALDWLNQFGSYPYPQITVVDRLRSGGMEYPMLIMNGSDRESLIVHEFGHVWFYGILANNEIDAAWLDEGFTSFQTNWYMESHYPPYGMDHQNTSDKKVGDSLLRFTSLGHRNQWRAIRFQTSGHDEPVQKRSYQYNSGSAYRTNVYTKGSRLLDELRYLMGDSLFLLGMNAYFNEWHLKHVNDERFITVMEKTYGDELDWFFDPWLYDTQLLDYSVKVVEKTRINDDTWKVTADIERLGERYYPMEIGYRDKEGNFVTKKLSVNPWGFSWTITDTLNFEPVDIVVDPYSKTNDIDFRNNYGKKMPTDWSLRWAEMRYNPRNKYVGSWFPLLYYHPIDGWMPGLSLNRIYEWEETQVRLSYATDSKKLFWFFSTEREYPVHFHHTTFSLTAYDYGGVSDYNFYTLIPGQADYGKPKPYGGFGFRFSQIKDTLRAPLFDKGDLTRFAGFYGIQLNQISFLSRLEISPLGWSDWGYSKLYMRIEQTTRSGRFSILYRYFAGKYWSTENLPKQEQFWVSGAHPFDRYEKSFLRHPESFYGTEDFGRSYHLAGDGNIRGFTGNSIPPMNAILTGNIQVGYDFSLPVVQCTITSFNDFGMVWDQNGHYSGDIIAAGGFGLELKKQIVHKSFYLRIDKPLWYIWNGSDRISVQLNDLIFSFERGL